ncbi:C2H2-type zinc finger transcription factor [Phycomyces blakesleeanus NRRL 1555(-)]|uniref:C2H2-type zinc finger transcription factor n=1 Tax=Phycomyces blakesleeanus (strain ATCC 8743b / DSM 1359 / FGSC 10004 / NBRC 33097 / NRRL 1555) TaxID=763407 RepID=A0A162N744_PHYB8|nr:C2H2-type zinc finger transcription factor [Phycomyces blakesleeanus NRRL 1555(-)]OAD66384.1 C2H2-type zinc finger transcription factor [Phycomyces blakesleeanus NRRL 1555(-)]|eukprot:XP_018284424.1 C2H2-type zinc finger transcription factor [Phycomyces blakesleeanus NRRL 1555(-)]
MSPNSILDSYQCNQCKECHTNLKKAKSCRAHCFKNRHRRHNDIQTSQTTPVPGQVSVVLNTVSNDIIDRERADAIEDQIMDRLNSEDNDDLIMNIFSNDDNDESMYDAELSNYMDIIENETSPLVFDFSQPASTLDKDDAKNLEFLKIIKDFVKHFNSILEMSTCITYRACTPHLGKKLLKRFSGVEETVHDICQRGCMLFTSPSQTECSNCGQSQYKTRRRETEGGDLVAAATMIQLPLARQLALALANENTRADMHYRHNHESSSDGSKTDVFDGQVYHQAKHLFSGKDDIAISLPVDGFTPHNVPGSVTILYATILNLNPMVWYERSRMLQIAMIPELLVLESEGMVVKTPNKTIRAKIHVLMVTGDIPALEKLACHSGHMSKDDCCICHVVGQCPKHEQYFRTLLSTNIRMLESFQNFSQASASSRKGLNGQSPLVTLKIFSRPLFFALDEMHGLCHGISKQVWGLVSGTYGTDHCFALSSGVQKEIGTAMYKTRNTISTSFHSNWRVVQGCRLGRLSSVCRPYAGGRAYWRCNCLERVTWLGSINLKYGTCTWNCYLQHLLQHYPLIIDAYGPPYAYSARSVEWAIGEYSRAIKSNSAINVNTGNIMFGLAQIRQAEAGATIMITEARTAQHLQYEDSTAGWPLTDEGERVGAGSDIEFWGPLRNRTIQDSFEGISCLSKLLEDFYKSKGEECSMIEAAIQTSHKTSVNSCVIDSALDQNCVREAHNIRLQIQVDENHNINSTYSLVYKDFFGKVFVFFEHKLNNKRWPLALVEIAAVRLVNDIPVVNNGQMKPKVVHLADVKELVGLVLATTQKFICIKNLGEFYGQPGGTAWKDV